MTFPLPPCFRMGNTSSLKFTKILLLVLFLCQCEALDEGGVPKLFPYGADQLDANLPRDVDDIASPEIRLQVPVVLYGQQYISIFINQNGLVSFNTDIPSFVNIQFPLDYPTIAPFYSDVDTRISGTVYYRETQSDDILERARTMFSDHFSSAVNFQPSSVVIVTWDDVGYFDRKSDKTNTYQLVIGSDGGDSYVVFLYDKIQWIQGTGKNPSLPDAKAQAGLISGHGPHFELKGSGTDQVSNIHKRSNSNEEGVWMFRVGRVGEILQEPDLVALESSSESSSSCATGGVTSCHSQSTCIDYSPGYCCQCSRGYFGNGRVCLQNELPLRVTGKVKGVFNGVGIEDSDLFSYIVPQDGRAYTAIAKVPERLGHDLQTVITLGTSIGWLFSTSANAPNGFMLTGGILNYTSEIHFQQTGHKVQVHQTFTGLDVFSHLRVETRIHGSAPNIPVSKTIEVNDLKMEFTRVSPGLLRSRSSHTYVIEGTSQEHPFTIEQTVGFEECPWAPPVPPELNTLSTKVGRHYIVYDSSQEIVRYAITSKVSPVDGKDPCEENKDKCGPDSSCVVDGDEFRCICNLGYEQRYNYEESDGSTTTSSSDQVPVCVDQDECQIGTSTCDVTAICYNSEGSYSCQCQEGYVGDGYTCTKILTCSDVSCGQNAQCHEISVGNPECKCYPGFTGDGLFCFESTGVEVDTRGRPQDCRHIRNLCDPMAECIYSSSSNSFICQCRQGYNGTGDFCDREEPLDEESCDIVNNCAYDATCKLDPRRNEYSCVCKSGFVGDGYTCRHSHGFESQQPPDPTCVFGTLCNCPVGYVYDDERGECSYVGETEQGEEQCDQDPSICDPNASCLFENGRFECSCNHGFGGSGRECSLRDYCSSHAECSPYGECAYEEDSTRYSCRCRDGFTGDGKDCRAKAEVDCNTLKNCDLNAECSWSRELSKYACECKPGFRGNGLTCQEEVLGCQILNNCGSNAECSYDAEAKGYRCQCAQNYEGDGYNCRSVVTCNRDPSICSVNAECTWDAASQEYKCSCRSGFYGDGKQCKQMPTNEGGDQLVVAKGMSLIKIQLKDSTPIPLTIEPFQTAIGLDFDCINQKLYWSDVASRSIKMSNINGTGKETFLDDDIQSPEGLAIDWASGNIYWTDSLKHTVEVASLKNNLRRIIISTGLLNPRGIAVYPNRGRLFWSDWNRDYPKIEHSGLDGQDRETLVGEGLSLPNSLVVDVEGDQLCWADAGNHKIECVGIDGRNRRTQVMNAKYPFGMAIGPDNFYWSDWESKKIESALRRNGEASTSYEVSLGGPGKLYGLVYIPAQCPQVYSPCEHSPCGDIRLCLPNSRGRRSCLCGEGSLDECQDLM